jgi:hypothetical protein
MSIAAKPKNILARDQRSLATLVRRRTAKTVMRLLAMRHPFTAVRDSVAYLAVVIPR